MCGLKSLRENWPDEMEPRRACPELVERGRLNSRLVQVRFEKRLGSATTFYATVALSFVIPSKPTCPGAPWRDLQFRGPLLETRNTMLKQNCHLDRSVAQWRDLRFLLVLT